MARKPSIVLGITYGHGDSAAALIINGTLVSAVEEERFSRIKHYALFPAQAIQYCLAQAGIPAHQVNAIAIARRPWNQLFQRLGVLWNNPSLLRRKHDRASEPVRPLQLCLKEAGLGHASLYQFEHHLAHLMTAKLLSGKQDMALLSFDGLGDFVSAAIGRPTKDWGVEILDRVSFPHSLGYFYTAMTQYLGFPYFGDEFKVMGLSSLGKPAYLESLRKVIREDTSRFGFKLNLEVFPVSALSTGHYLQGGQPFLRPHYNGNLLRQIVGVAPRKSREPITEVHANLAKSVQTRFEEVANHLLKQLAEKVPSSTLGVSGGCAHNSVWVGKIPQNCSFKEVVVFPASHDAGIAVGAAALAACTPISVEAGNWALLGPDETYGLDNSPGTPAKVFSDEEKLIQWMVDQLCAKKIIGLCKGRMEFGPRALGSRSILADPRVAEMKDILNARIKHREKFRPFAASVLFEHQDKWFKNVFYSPYMEAVFEVKQASKIPAVVHDDGTCRIQSVTKDTQPFYWNLIEAFRRKTGIPMLINTSFNDSEPIVLNEKTAFECFQSTDMDCLVVGLKVFEKNPASQALSA